MAGTMGSIRAHGPRAEATIPSALGSRLFLFIDVIGMEEANAAPVDDGQSLPVEAAEAEMLPTPPDQQPNDSKPKRKKQGRRAQTGPKSPPSKRQRTAPSKSRSDSSQRKERLQRKLASVRAEVKAEFEQTREEILGAYPPHLKDMFGEMGFTKWSGKVYSCIILNPYHVPPSDVRRTFYGLFRRLERQQALDRLSYLIYFYGEQNPNQMYTFIAQSQFVPFEKGKTLKNHFPVLLESRKKMEEGKKLNKVDEYNLRALQEIEEDLAKDKSERRRMHFPEEYDLLSETDLLEVEDSDSEENDGGRPTPEPLALEDSVKPPVKKKRGRPRKQKPSEDETNSLAPNDIEAMGETAMELDEEDAANIAYALGESDSGGEEKNENEDGWQGPESAAKLSNGELEEDLIPVNKARGKSKKLKLPKSSEDNRGETDKAKKPRSKKVERELTPLESAKREFLRCEKEYRPFVQTWEMAVLENDLKALSKCFEQASTVVDDCSAPFLEAYFADLVKRTKSLLRDTNGTDELLLGIKRIGKHLKELYNEKKALVPPGFTIPKIKPLVILDKVAPVPKVLPVQAERKTGMNSTEMRDGDKEPSRRAKSMSPVRLMIHGHDEPASFSVLSESKEKPQQPSQKNDRKAFSLGKLKHRFESQPQQDESEASSSKLNLPRWLTDAQINSIPTDPDRSLALDFLKDMASHFQQDKLDHSSVALSVESAIYDWARRVAVAVNESTAEEPAPMNQTTNSDNKAWVDIYWNRVHAIVSAVCGEKGVGSGALLSLFRNGTLSTAESLVNLTDEQLKKSFHGVAI